MTLATERQAEIGKSRTVDKIKSWTSLALMLLPVLRMLPIPWLQAILDILGNGFIGTAGVGGLALSANSGKAIGKNVA